MGLIHRPFIRRILFLKPSYTVHVDSDIHQCLGCDTKMTGNTFFVQCFVQRRVETASFSDAVYCRLI
uniref:Uncharacterized protein n=1 Tax=Anguilla anguilla TaxID=7936 RepID=A0A0E9Y077_ANGAN